MEGLLANPRGYWVSLNSEFDDFDWLNLGDFFLYEGTFGKPSSLLGFPFMGI
jgi:hypothetical protein